MPKIMVVEDVEDIREMVAEILRFEGYEVLEAVHGQHALELLDACEEAPCLMLLDLMMPVMSGKEVLHTLHERGALATLPVVVVSAAGRPEDAQGARMFVPKPSTHERLLELVEEICGPSPRQKRALV